MDKITQLEILAHAFLGGLVELHGRKHAAHILNRLAEGLMSGRPLRGSGPCGGDDNGENGRGEFSLARRKRNP
jgi:hypothetical protein